MFDITENNVLFFNQNTAAATTTTTAAVAATTTGAAAFVFTYSKCDDRNNPKSTFALTDPQPHLCGRGGGRRNMYFQAPLALSRRLIYYSTTLLKVVLL